MFHTRFAQVAKIAKNEGKCGVYFARRSTCGLNKRHAALEEFMASHSARPTRTRSPDIRLFIFLQETVARFAVRYSGMRILPHSLLSLRSSRLERSPEVKRMRILQGEAGVKNSLHFLRQVYVSRYTNSRNFNGHVKYCHKSLASHRKRLMIVKPCIY